MNNQFSENLKKIRKEHNLSQEQLADDLGVSRQAISKWESSTAYPEMDKIITLCDKFNLNIDDLLHGDIKEIKGEEESKRKINKVIDDFLNFITDTVNMFSNMSFKSKIKCLFEQFIIIGMLCLTSFIVLSLCDSFLSRILRIFPDKVNHFLYQMLGAILIVFCFGASIIIVVHVFKIRYLNYYNKLRNVGLNNSENDKIDIENTNDNSNVNENKKIFFKTNEKQIIIRDSEHSEYRFINAIFKFLIGIIKIFTIFIAIFLIFILISILLLFVLSFQVSRTGMFFVGLLGISLSSATITIVFLLLIINFVFNRKNDKKKMIWTFIISIIFLGISCGLTFAGTLNFKIENSLITQSKEFEMNDKLFFEIYGYRYGYDKEIKYIESNIDNIKVEYKVNKYCQLASERYYQNDGIYLRGYCPDVLRYNDNPIELVRDFLDNLNDKKIEIQNSKLEDIIIYASKDNIEKLKANKNNHNGTLENY